MKHFLIFTKLLTANKAFEAQISGQWTKSPNIILAFELFDYNHWLLIQINLFNFIDLTISWTRRSDHAGFQINLQLIYFFFLVNLYDTRHWNHDADRFQTTEEAEKEYDDYLNEVSKKMSQLYEPN